jgi:hypothetical protein
MLSSEAALPRHPSAATAREPKRLQVRTSTRAQCIILIWTHLRSCFGPGHCPARSFFHHGRLLPQTGRAASLQPRCQSLTGLAPPCMPDPGWITGPSRKRKRCFSRRRPARCQRRNRCLETLFFCSCLRTRLAWLIAGRCNFRRARRGSAEARDSSLASPAGRRPASTPLAGSADIPRARTSTERFRAPRRGAAGERLSGLCRLGVHTTIEAANRTADLSVHATRLLSRGRRRQQDRQQKLQQAFRAHGTFSTTPSSHNLNPVLSSAALKFSRGD